MTLSQVQMEKLLDEAPRKEAGDVRFDCPNCEKEHHETIWVDAWEVDDEGNLMYDGPQATTVCECGASVLVAWQPDGEGERYWLNKKDMQDSSRARTGGDCNSTF